MPAYSVGLGAVFVGGYLIDCAVQGRPPVKTLVAMISNPTGYRDVLKNSKSSISWVAQPGDWGGTAAPVDPSTTGSWGEGSGADAAVAFARAQIGKPYGWGATGPNAYDCSGLVQAAWKAGGVSLPRTTAQMIFSGRAVAKADLIPGDLVFPDAGHVQIYSNNGNVIEAPHTGTVIRECKMWGFMAARRVGDSTVVNKSLASKLGET